MMFWPEIIHHSGKKSATSNALSKDLITRSSYCNPTPDEIADKNF